MKLTIPAAALALVLTLAVEAQARPLTIAIAMANYSGPQAFLVAYLVDAKGSYVSTLYAAGSSGRYFEHLDRWYRMFRRAHGKVDGTTGASLGSGRHRNVSVDVPDKLFNAGYTLRIESAVEGEFYVPDEAAVSLDDAHNGAATSGQSFVNALTLTF